MGESAARHGRGFVLVDDNPEAVDIAAARLAFAQPECVGFAPGEPALGYRSARRRRRMSMTSEG